MPKNKCDSILLGLSFRRTEQEKNHISFKIVIDAIKIMYKFNSKNRFSSGKNTQNMYKEGIKIILHSLIVGFPIKMFIPFLALKLDQRSRLGATPDII